MSAPKPMKARFAKDSTVPAASSQVGARHGRYWAGRSARWIQPAFRFRKLKIKYPTLAAPMMNTLSESSSSNRLNTRFVHIALTGAPCALHLDRYRGSQPSSDAWYSVREDPAIDVI